MPTAFALAPFPILMVIAAFYDLITFRIPNWISVVLAAGFLLLSLTAGLSWQLIGLHLVIALGVLFVAFVFFALRWMGGGDAKLVAATALWFGATGGPTYLMAAAICGGVLTLGLLLARVSDLKLMVAHIVWLDQLLDKSRGIPYGIALAAAGLLVYPQSPIYLHFAS